MPEADRQKIFVEAREALLTELPETQAIYVHGSFARGEESPRSDLDLAVLLPARHHSVDVLELTSRIAARIGRDVDLVDLRSAGDVLRREVLDSGRTIYVSDADGVLAWEASAMSRIAHHREEIRGILEDFERTGIGYAP